MCDGKLKNRNVWLLSVFGILSIGGIVLINVDMKIGGVTLVIIALVFLMVFIISAAKLR